MYKIISLLPLYLIYILYTGGVTCYTELTIFEEEDTNRLALPIANISSFTVPGTKWCGPGYTANNYNDLGKYQDTDMCCRDHDHCEIHISSQQSLYNITNKDKFPIMHCDCEKQFINCLRKVNSVISHTLGYIYFSARGQCMELAHPIIGCVHYQLGTFRRRCVRYNVDEKKAKIWQLFDIPFYSFSFRDNSMEEGGNNNEVEEIKNDID